MSELLVRGEPELARPVPVAHALARAASAFWSALVGRPSEAASGRVPNAPPAALSSRLRTAGVENRCPVCQASFRGARICLRCGTDLEPLMLLAVKAWQLRQAARQALNAGDLERALGFALEAQGIQSTESGEALRLLGRWLKSRKTQIQLRSRPMKATTAAKAAMAAHHLAPDGSISRIADAGCSGL